MHHSMYWSGVGAGDKTITKSLPTGNLLARDTTNSNTGRWKQRKVLKKHQAG